MPNSIYPDLQLTNFPDNIDTFTTYLDILASDGVLIKQYMDAMNNGDSATANQILEQIPAASQKIIKATDLNKLTQAILAVERFYKTDIEPYVESKQQEWITVLSQFDYIGVWSSGTSYIKNNFVTYTINGLTLMYVATANLVPVGTPPTNVNYWRLLTIQGQQGVSGKGLSYRQIWNQSESYNVDEAVTYNGALWMALQSNTGIEPGTNSDYWKSVIKLDVTTYPIQAAQPLNQREGELWFNTQSNPTKYYYLPLLSNPAIASQIAYGYEVYDDQGNKIIGTMPVPVSISVTAPPSRTEYLLGEVFDPAGMVVSLTYSDGKTEVVSNYDYSPKTPLTAQDTTITINYKEFSTTVNITVLPYDSVLNNNSWQQIREASDSNKASTVWSVGDAKEITLNGTIGIATYNNLKTWVYILGFNHNAEREGNNMIHFGGFRTTQEYTGSNSIALDDDKIGTITSSIAFNMNDSGTNSGGWKTSRMRTTIIDADATSPSASTGNTFLHALPSELKSVMKRCVKYTDNSGGGNNVASDVTSTQDWAFLLSEFEVQGARNYANSAEQTYQKQYDYYKNGNSKIKYRQTSPNSPRYWWNRSPYANASDSFCYVNAGGYANFIDAAASYGFAPAFCV